jgi:NADPH:quinone reductase-like Zn-dependent oxidoreductase
VRAAQIAELGAQPEPVEVAEPVPDTGDTLVRVLAVAFNPLDIAVGAGRFYGGHPPLPYSPGCEAVGRTEDGELVYLFGDGRGIGKPGFLVDRTAVPRELPLPLPAGTDPVLAAAAGIAGIAAWVPVAWKAKVGPGDRVLVLGASGTVGLLAVQAARLLGAAWVVAAGRDLTRLERARELGAGALVQLGDVDALADAFGGDGFTVCIDPLWGEPLAQVLGAAAQHARIVHLGQSAGPESPVRSADVRGKELQILGHSNFALSSEERGRAQLELIEHLADGRITLDVERFPFEGVGAAWECQRAARKAVVELA